MTRSKSFHQIFLIGFGTTVPLTDVLVGAHPFPCSHHYLL
nr:MAG TPA: hypothetical protein [Caudoviricetes sp.]